LNTGGVAGSDELYELFAQVGRALSSPVRIQLLDLLCQGERSVEQLAATAGVQVANTSAHLQVLRRCRLVEIRRARRHVFYRLADDEVARFFLVLREFARARSVEVQRVVADFIVARDELDPVPRDVLLERMVRQEVVVIDVRPIEEYRSGHIPGAISMPLAEIPDRIPELSGGSEIVAYCRGPYCVLAPDAVALLRRSGLPARRLQDGFPEWRLAGLPVTVAEEGSR
jgi:rhodanese-related sulfurtransferase/DNA-binding transcriptional ArsR family regulator